MLQLYIALKSIIKSFISILSQLYLEEEDVWRAVLNWAKYQAGVTQPTAHWTEEERARVCQHLATVINHVRLLLIGMLIIYMPVYLNKFHFHY